MCRGLSRGGSIPPIEWAEARKHYIIIIFSTEDNFIGYRNLEQPLRASDRTIEYLSHRDHQLRNWRRFRLLQQVT
jgi:hypothetical protein